MASTNEMILRTSKEIVVKFIEVGRVSPTSFGDVFKTIYTNVKSIVEEAEEKKEAVEETKQK